MKTFLFRLCSSSFLIAIFCWILLSNTLAAFCFFYALSIFLTVVSTMEFHSFFSDRLHELKVHRIIAVIFSIIAPITVIYFPRFGFSFLNALFFLLILLFVVLVFLLIFSKKNFESFTSLILIFMPLLTFIIPLIHFIPIYQSDKETTFYSAAFLIFVTKSGDMGAYLFGTITAKYMKGGNHKMIPSVSPKKSWEGFFAGFFITIVVAYFCKNLISANLSIIEILCIGIFLYIGSVLGDLFESAIKRVANVKDSGAIIPGIGGVLDLVDSLILNAPLFYFYLQIKGVVR